MSNNPDWAEMAAVQYDLQRERDELRAENERLRTVLLAIAMGTLGDRQMSRGYIHKIAAEALEQPRHGQGSDQPEDHGLAERQDPDQPQDGEQ